MSLLRRFPAFVILVLIAAGLMLIPAIHAAQAGLWHIARTFLYHAAFVASLAQIFTDFGTRVALVQRRDAGRYGIIPPLPL